MQKTNIEWTVTNGEPGFTANPLKYRDKSGAVVWGCVKVSPGCTHCYAETLANRYGRGGPFKQSVMDGLTPFLDEKELHRMLTYKPASGGRVFLCDMTDVFGEWVPDELLDRLFAVLALRSDVTWQLLTKRAERMRDYFDGSAKDRSRQAVAKMIEEGFDTHGLAMSALLTGVAWPLPNVWLGVSVEDQPRADERIPLLLQVPAVVRFLSVEPLLGPISFADGPLHPEESTMGEWSVLDLGIKWVIVGGESGPGSRPTGIDWARSIVQECKAAGVPVFVKQLGAKPRMTYREYVEWRPNAPAVDCHPDTLDTIRLIDRKGGDPDEWPKDLNVREFPTTPPH